jgi:short-subunit dehydrogenase
LTKTNDQIKACDLIEKEVFDLVVYCAGGGPHGLFESKEWKDHAWALQLNLFSPMLLVHHWLKARRAGRNGPGRFVIVGSRIAEQNPDPLASSYAAAKAGIHGFVSSVQEELEESPNKVWLFSPGYMDTDLLPSTSRVRHDGSKLMSPESAALALLRWLKKDGPWHRVLN